MFVLNTSLFEFVLYKYFCLLVPVISYILGSPQYQQYIDLSSIGKYVRMAFNLYNVTRSLGLQQTYKISEKDWFSKE